MLTTFNGYLIKKNTYSCLLVVDCKVHQKGLEYSVSNHTTRHHDFLTVNNLEAKHIQLLIGKVMLFRKVLDHSPTYY